MKSVSLEQLEMRLSSKKPYFIRACYDWLVDNALTPYLLVDANYLGNSLPQAYVQNGRIVLNISPTACHGLHINNNRIVFSARFAGKALQVVSLARGGVGHLCRRRHQPGHAF